MSCRAVVNAALAGILLAAAASCGTGIVAAGAPAKGEWIWEGERRIEGLVVVPEGTTLRLLPGTRLEFAYEDRNGDGYGDNGLHVLGRIVASGTESAPVVFTAAGSDPQPGDWAGLLLDNSRGNLFEHCVFQYARHALHTHFSEGKILRSRIADNIEGTRLGDSRFEIAYNLIRGNISKGLNFRSCANHIHHNTVTGNGHGIFLFETDTESVIEQNNFLGNEGYDLRLGDFYEGGIELRDNWWGSADAEAVRGRIFEGDGASERGRVRISPAPRPIPNGWEGR